MEVESIKSTNFEFVRFADLRTEPYKSHSLLWLCTQTQKHYILIISHSANKFLSGVVFLALIPNGITIQSPSQLF